MTVAFIGHRKIDDTPALRERVGSIIEGMITGDNADTFLFGSRSEFNDLCYETVTLLKKKYEHIRRVYVRAEYEYINDEYNEYLLSEYEETYFPEKVHGANALSYIKRNEVMIDSCDVLVVYCDKNGSAASKNGKSGTRAAVAYAVKAGKKIVNTK